jgi:hypothetical protein
MRATEFLSESTITPGMTLYHGTAEKNVIGIMKHGLVPRYNRWETKYGGDPKTSTKGVFTTPSLEDAKNFMPTGYGAAPGVIFAFKLLPTDQVESERFFRDEIIVMNPISPDRLQIVWPPEKANILDKKKAQAQASFDKTEIIKQINKLTRPFGAFCKSASKTTPRIITYSNDPQYYDQSVLLKDYPAYLVSKGIDQAVVAQVAKVIGL